MRYDPKDAERPLFPDGKYNAQIVNAEEKKSKAGNDMLVATFQVWDGSRTTFVDDYYAFNAQAMLARLKKLCVAIDVDFFAGEITPAHVLTKSLTVEVKTRKGKEREDGSGFYDDQNVIAGYFKSNETTTEAPLASDGPAGDDDNIPF